MEIESNYEQELRANLTSKLAEINERMKQAVEEYFSGLLTASEHREDGYSHPPSEILANMKNVEESIVEAVEIASHLRIKGFEDRLVG
ncbi:hypothetical protein [Candidatus Poriferisocius sp.]|uniref:hypothetical protein n=1 Tax=Candidatus Poriferisocius sp. TaxID=3101276 RepID=UPI003B0270CD